MAEALELEWGRLLAYLPQVKRRMERRQPRVVLLPPPQLGRANERGQPSRGADVYAAEQRRAVQEIRHDAEELAREHLDATDRLEFFDLVARDRT